MSNDYEAQLALEDHFQQEAALTFDYREGVEAFIRKRPPVFRGE
jgi:2-(1,2-epoxy-1,2-dihydrophenyl)acetyl-CoA isomerase